MRSIDSGWSRLSNYRYYAVGAGATIPVYDATSGEAWPASLFVAVLGASSYTFAEATRDQQLEAWIQAHIHALEFFSPPLTHDNLRGANYFEPGGPHSC